MRATNSSASSTPRPGPVGTASEPSRSSNGSVRILPTNGESATENSEYVGRSRDAAKWSDARVRLARGQADRNQLEQASIAFVVVRGERLFEPVEADVLEPSDELVRAFDRIGHSSVQHQVTLV